MRLRSIPTLIFGLAAALLATTAFAPDAQACGGFFCNAGTQSPIYQAGERVVFAQNPGGGVTMHIEIAYQGEPTDFGWIMPIEPPTDAQGNLMPLDEVLHVSTSALFDQLQAATDPRFTVQNRFERDACEMMDPFPTFDAATGADFASDAGGQEPPPVVVLQKANIGPYGAVMLEATDADALYEWLADNGYLQDPSARPLLQHYIQKNFVFLGLRLQNGKSSGDIRPVELQLGETFACVPLRLTQIAAVDDMPMLVWVLGDYRAIPKNFLHAVVNPLALTWPGAANYLDVISAGLDSIHGRGFLTEYASPDPIMDGQFYNDRVAAAEDTLVGAETLRDLLPAIDQLGGANDGELVEILRTWIPMPEGLTGYPHGNCYYDPYYTDPNQGDDVGPTDTEPGDTTDTDDTTDGSGSVDAGGSGGAADVWGYYECPDNETHVTTEGEFYGYLDFWITELSEQGTPLEVDVAGLVDAILYNYIQPRARIQAMFDDTGWITRFFSVISPHEMSRDPIFAFNADLGAVSGQHTVETVVRTDSTCSQEWVDATYETGRKVRFECSSSRCTDRSVIGPVPDAPPLLRVEVVDESGQPEAFDPAQAEEVDQLLDQAVPGSPSLPASFELQPPPKPEVDDDATTIVRNDDTVVYKNAEPSGCGCRIASTSSTDSGTAPLGHVAWLALVGIGLALVRRRRRR